MAPTAGVQNFIDRFIRYNNILEPDDGGQTSPSDPQTERSAGRAGGTERVNHRKVEVMIYELYWHGSPLVLESMEGSRSARGFDTRLRSYALVVPIPFFPPLSCL